MARRARRRLEYLPTALADLQRLQHDDPVLAAEAGRVLNDVAAGRRDGEPLSAMAATGDLSDCRKIYFGHRNLPTHRVVLQIRPDGTVEVLLVVAVEARADAYVYLLSAERLRRLPPLQQPNLDRLGALCCALCCSGLGGPCEEDERLLSRGAEGPPGCRRPSGRPV